MSQGDDSTRDVHTRLLDDRIDRALERRFPPGSGGGGDDGVERRIEGLEADVAEIKTSLLRIESKIDQLPQAPDFFELKGRVSQLPTVWQLFGVVIAIFALAFALLRFGMPQG